MEKASHIIGDVSHFRALTEETEKREYGDGGFQGLDPAWALRVAQAAKKI
jgi:hypothetical protein